MYESFSSESLQFSEEAVEEAVQLQVCHRPFLSIVDSLKAVATKHAMMITYHCPPSKLSTNGAYFQNFTKTFETPGARYIPDVVTPLSLSSGCF